MAIRDYASENEDDFYGQNFECPGVVSVWLGLRDAKDDPAGLDVLQDLCGIGYYSLDQQESNCFDFKLSPLIELIGELSYSQSYCEELIEAAERMGIKQARYIVLQFDFNYDLERVKRSVCGDPIFIGSFNYSVESF